MTSKDDELCGTYDQIAGRTCCYYAGHGGSHNFGRRDPDSSLERELRRQLDEVARGLAEALDLFDANWCPEHGYAPTPEAFAEAARLSKLVGRGHAFYDSMVEATTSRRRTR